MHYDPSCCHRTRLAGASCPLGRKCPYDTASVGDTNEAHLPVRTLPVPTPDVFLHAWKT